MVCYIHFTTFMRVCQVYFLYFVEIFLFYTCFVCGFDCQKQHKTTFLNTENVVYSGCFEGYFGISQTDRTKTVEITVSDPK